jgi:hypothetical protein
LAPIVDHDAVPVDALREVLVGRADHDLVDLGREGARRAGDRVVGFELDHRPRNDSERPHRRLGELELPMSAGSTPSPVL